MIDCADYGQANFLLPVLDDLVILDRWHSLIFQVLELHKDRAVPGENLLWLKVDQAGINDTNSGHIVLAKFKVVIRSAGMRTEICPIITSLSVIISGIQRQMIAQVMQESAFKTNSESLLQLVNCRRMITGLTLPNT